MQFLQKIKDFYIFSNIHVALAGFCMAKISLLKFENSSYKMPVFIALSIVVSYNFIRFYEIKTSRLIWLKTWFYEFKKSLIVLSAFSTLGIWYILGFTNFNFNSLIILIPFALITFFYVVPVYKNEKIEVSFRNFPSIKIFSIAISWAAICVLFALDEANIALDKNVWIEFVQRFFILIAITLPFDIRDVNYDSKKLKTLPHVLGVKTSKQFGLILLIIFVLLTFFKENYLISEVYINIIVSIITGCFLWFSSAEKSRYYTSFWVEAIPVFWLFLIVLF
ncbi:hypothetical protein [Lutibacter sp. HS1-25]|uniref:hypothetical protein n=1 Tax=Lutibacter sp. HS1-25 TaxID=2485000 RepID=UPI00101199DC|nr:hypothetical protein [Lutibacter sp. HS1-25]